MVKLKFPKPKRIPKKYINQMNRQESRSAIIKELDEIVSKRVRERDDYTCIHCGTRKVGGLTCSHYWNRGKLSVRWNMENLDTACWPCHHYHLEGKKQGWYRHFKLKQLGIDHYYALEVRANTPFKISTAELKLALNLMEKGLL